MLKSLTETPRLKHIKVMLKGGKRYVYYYDKKSPLVRLPDVPENDPEFLEAYAKAARKAAQARVDPPIGPQSRKRRRQRMYQIVARLCQRYKTEEINADLVARLIIDNEIPERVTLGLTGSVPHKVRWSIYRRDKFTCRICGVRNVEMTLDHIFPVSKGGTNDPNNLQTVCRNCNAEKRDKLPK